MDSCAALQNSFVDAHRSLFSLASNSAGVPNKIGEAVLGELGGSAVHAYPGPYFSTINNNSSPLQLCHSLDSKGMTRIKLIVDPYAYLAPGAERLNLTLERLNGISQQRETTLQFKEAIRCLNRVFLPAKKSDRKETPHRGGYCWFASDMHRKGLAVYYSPRYVGGCSWGKLDELMGALGVKTSQLNWLTKLKSMDARLASVAVQNVCGECELKVYWRMSTPHSLLEQPHPLFSDPVLIQSIARLYPEQGVANHGLLFSKSIALPSGEATGIKIDLCGHCLRYNQTEWLQRLSELPINTNSNNSELFFNNLKAFWQSNIEIAFVSLGMDIHGKIRCNLYWKVC